MAFTCGFFNSVQGDRKYNSKQISEMFDGLIVDGVFAHYGTHFNVSPVSGMDVRVGSGRFWFNHVWGLNDGNTTLRISPADVSAARMDAIVIEIDSRDEVRNAFIKVINGAVGGVKPTLTHTETFNQYPLAYVTVPAAASSITAANITVVVGTSECPFATGVLEGVNVDNLFDQWDAQFTEWFTNLQAQLSDNVVANLQSQIDEVKKSKADKSEVKPPLAVLNVGDLYESLNNLETSTNGKMIKCDGRALGAYDSDLLKNNFVIPVGLTDQTNISNTYLSTTFAQVCEIGNWIYCKANYNIGNIYKISKKSPHTTYTFYTCPDNIYSSISTMSINGTKYLVHAMMPKPSSTSSSSFTITVKIYSASANSSDETPFSIIYKTYNSTYKYFTKIYVKNAYIICWSTHTTPNYGVHVFKINESGTSITALNNSNPCIISTPPSKCIVHDKYKDRWYFIARYSVDNSVKYLDLATDVSYSLAVTGTYFEIITIQGGYVYAISHTSSSRNLLVFKVGGNSILKNITVTSYAPEYTAVANMDCEYFAISINSANNLYKAYDDNMNVSLVCQLQSSGIDNEVLALFKPISSKNIFIKLNAYENPAVPAIVFYPTYNGTYMRAFIGEAFKNNSSTYWGIIGDDAGKIYILCKNYDASNILLEIIDSNYVTIPEIDNDKLYLKIFN